MPYPAFVMWCFLLLNRSDSIINGKSPIADYRVLPANEIDECLDFSKFEIILLHMYSSDFIKKKFEKL